MANERYDYSPIIHRKPLAWPNGARVAVWVIPNVEWFDIERPASGPAPDIRNFSRMDYGPRIGIWRIMETLDSLKIRATVALNSAVCEHYPAIIEEGKIRGWEFMGHGITNSRIQPGMAEAEERRMVHEVVTAIARGVGQPPRGWLGPGLGETFHSLDILSEAGIEYVCDWVNDDQPYPMRTSSGRIISIPYSIEINDRPLFGPQTWTGRDFLELTKDTFDTLYREGATNGRVMALALHPYLIGTPGRIKYLREALEYIGAHQGVWFATGSEIVDWYCGNYLVES